MNDRAAERIVVTRRSALTGLGAAMSAVALLPAPAAQAAPVNVPLIDRAEALLAEVCAIFPYLSERDQSNLGSLFAVLEDAGGATDSNIPGLLEEARGLMGSGNRTHDRIDRADAAIRRAFVSHADLVAGYAAAYHTREPFDDGDPIRAELVETHGDELGAAIAGAAFRLYIHQKYHGEGLPADCDRCDDD